MHQEEILNKITQAFENGVKVVILEAPPGFGKSPVNIALAKFYGPSFYTTPQKKLVNQIANQFGPDKLVIDMKNIDSYDCIPLLGRNTYQCKHTNKKSDECPIYKNGGITIINAKTKKEEFIEQKCSGQSNCTYWEQKKACMNANISVITFAMLIINNYIKEYKNNSEEQYVKNYEFSYFEKKPKKQIKFEKRKLLIIDECSSLEDQIASMFCGFKITPKRFPKNYRDTIWDFIDKNIPMSDSIDDYIDFLKSLNIIIEEKIRQNIAEKDKRKFSKILNKIEYMLEEVIEENRKWIVNVFDKGKKYVEFKPIKIDRFLSKMVWSQADKIILSSATIPFRNDIEKWLKILGLQDKKYKFFSVSTTFPIENRPIITSYLGGRMTSKKEEENWNLNMSMVKKIIDENIDNQGVIHSVSYNRGKRLYNELILDSYSVFFHDKNNYELLNGNDIINTWIKSKKKILISPAVVEGVDLINDLCRYQILFKVPYLNYGDKRTKYLVDIENQWNWYYEKAVSNIVQMYGRGVRHENDWCKFYIVDRSFMDLIRKKRNSFPKYFLETIPRNDTDVFLDEFCKI